MATLRVDNAHNLSDAPFVSVCIPTYNRAQYIADAIKSVLDQTFQDFEIIVADDGSTDNTREVVAGFSDSRIRYHRKEHSGAPETRNFAIQKARGTYIDWLDSDDIFHPSILEKLVAVVRHDPAIDVAYVNLLAVDPMLNPIRELKYEDWYNRSDALLSKMIFENPVPNPGSLIKRSAFSVVGPYNIKFRRAHDYEWWSRAALCLKFKLVDEFLYLWRWHDTNMSSGSVKIDTSFELALIDGLINQHGFRKLLPDLSWEKNSVEATAQSHLLISRKYAELRQTDAAIRHAREAFRLSGVSELHNVIKEYQKIAFAETKTAPLHVLFVSHNFINRNAGGTENYIYALANALKKMNIEVEVFYPCILPVPDKQIVHGEYNGIRFHELQYKGPEFFQQYISDPEIEQLFKDFLSNDHYDIVHFHHTLNLPMSLVSKAKATGIPVIVTCHDAYFLCQRIHLLYTGKGNVICSGPESADKCAKCIGINETFFRQRFAAAKIILETANLVTAPSAFMSGIFSKNHFSDNVQVKPLGLSHIEHLPKVSHSGITYGYIGSIHTLKNVSFLVQVFRHLPEEQLVIYGNGATEAVSELEAMVASSQNIKYKGDYRPDDIAQVLTNFDVLIVPSLLENYPLTIREAFSVRMPVFASNRGGIPEIINNGINGFLFDPVDENSLIEVIHKVRNRPEIINELATNIAPVKTMEEDASEWEEQYLALIGLHRKPLVSIIIPVFNKIEFTRRCIETLYRFTDVNLFEVIVIDNGSTDSSEKELRDVADKVPNLQYFRNSENLGFARANNQGAKHARGRYLLLLNNDTEFVQSWLQPLVNVLDNDHEVAAVGAKLLFPDRTIQHAGVFLVEDHSNETALLSAHHTFYGLPENEPYTIFPRIVSALTAACLLLRRKEYLEIGGLDENFWNGYEDVDLCLRLTQNGKKLVFQPECLLLHHESKSGAERFSRVQENIQRLNNLWAGKINVDFVKQQSGELVQVGPGIVPYKKGKMALTSIIIPVYNNVEYTRQCIDSLKKSTQLPYEVIIVNNASSDGTADYLSSLRASSDNFIIIENQVNLGFPGAVNQGLKAASGAHVVIANNDLVFTPQWLDRLINLAESNHLYGITAPMSNFVSGVQIDKEAAYTTIDQMFAYAKQKSVSEKGRFFEFPRVAFLCVLIKREVIDKLGGLDERFAPGNFEDDDFCLRAQFAGYTCAIAKDVFIHHFGSKSFLADGEKKYQARLEKNKELFVKKWGFDPNEIWLQGKQPKKRNITIPFHGSRYAELVARMQSLIAENDYETAKLEVERILTLIAEPDFAVSPEEKSHFLKMQDKLRQITNTVILQETN